MESTNDEAEVVMETVEADSHGSSEESTGKLDIRAALEAAAQEHGMEEADDKAETPEPSTDTKTATRPQTDLGKVKAQAPVQETQLEPPQFWTKEEKALFAKAPAEVQKAVLKHENQRNAWANKIATEVQPLKQKYKDVEEAFAPVKQQLDLNHISEGEAAKRIMTWQRYMDNPETRVDTIRQFLATYNLKPEDLIQQEPEEGSAYDPRVDELQRRLDEYEQKAVQTTEAQQAAQQQAFAGQVQAWKNQTGEDGQPLRPNVDLFMHQIAQVGEQLMQAYPDRHLNEILDSAYNYVMDIANKRLVEPKLGQVQQANQQRVNAVKRAGSSVVSTPSVGTAQAKPKNMRDALETAARMHGY
jgi:chromosome segregation ATPase